MGRITVFSNGDLNSRRVISALEDRKLPFVAISTVQNPEKCNDLRELSQSYAVPKIFFNSRCIGGVDELMKELKLWDDQSQYSSATEKYLDEIAASPDPTTPKLAPPPSAAVGSPRREAIREPVATITLKDGTMTSVWNMTEKLKNSLPLDTIQHGGSEYKKAFSGRSARDVFQASLSYSKDEAIAFGNILVDAKIFRSVDSSSKVKFQDTDGAIYRLQCHCTPEILNSYRIWSKKSESSPIPLIESLDMLLERVELAACDKKGRIDYSKASRDRNYHMFEESVCELQQVDISGLGENQKLAFALNLYQMMVRYAFVKVGIPEKKVGFLRNVKFDLGGMVFSLQDWFDGVLRANSRITFSGAAPLSMVDRRRKLALSKLDNRVHFAVSVHAAMGSRSSLPFRRFTADNIDDELYVAACVLCADDDIVSTNKVSRYFTLPTFLQWYRLDFAKMEPDMVTVISQYFDGAKKVAIRDAMEVRSKPRYVEGDWKRHAKNFVEFEPESLVGVVTSFGFGRRFQAPKITSNEKSRVSTLKKLNLLDTLPEERFDRITAMVRDEFKVPIAFVSFIDENRQWYKSAQWFNSTEL